MSFLKNTFLATVAASFIASGAQAEEAKDVHNIQGAKKNVEVQKVEEAIKTKVTSITERNELREELNKELLAELKGLDINNNGILEPSEQQKVDTKGQLDELMAETLGISHDEFINQIGKNKEVLGLYSLKDKFIKAKLVSKRYNEGRFLKFSPQKKEGYAEKSWLELIKNLKEGNVNAFGEDIYELLPELEKTVLATKDPNLYHKDTIKFFEIKADIAEKEADIAEKEADIAEKEADIARINRLNDRLNKLNTRLESINSNLKK